MHAAVTPPAIPIIVMPRGVVAILVFVGLAPSEADSRVQSEQAQVPQHNDDGSNGQLTVQHCKNLSGHSFSAAACRTSNGRRMTAIHEVWTSSRSSRIPYGNRCGSTRPAPA
jgi:hypothetical protein